MKQINWNYTADVVIIGYGAAGAVAAITAHDAGAEVVIIEKQETQSPMNTSYMSGGLFISPSSIEESKKYMKALYKVSDDLYWTDPDILDVWAQYSIENKKWFENIGGMAELYCHGGQHKLPGVEAIDIYRLRGLGPGMMRLINDQINNRGIKVLTCTQATGLISDYKGEVLGVSAIQNSETKKLINVQARRASILTTGGFEFDEQLKLQHLKVYPSYFTASPASTGDGIRMAAGVGAQLWHMNCVSAGWVMKFPEVPVGLSPIFGGKYWISPNRSALPELGGIGWLADEARQLAVHSADIPGYMVVDRFGRRFTNENTKGTALYYELTLFDSQKLIHPRVPSYYIFDQRRIDDSPMSRHTSGPTGPARIYNWSKDNMAELEKGWIKHADTVEELALTLEIDPQSLAETVSNYNQYCKLGNDKECGREPETMRPLESPPYYAVALWPGGVNTQGGPKKNSKSQILRADGSPVPRLYGGGELGSIYGMLYPTSGGNLAECVAFGRIAGENASQHSPL